MSLRTPNFFDGDVTQMVTTRQYIDTIKARRSKLMFIAKCTFVAVAVAFLALAAALAVDLFKVFNTNITLEAGDELPSAYEVCGKKNAKYEYDEDEIDLSVPGEYKINIAYGEGKSIKVKVKVVDTVAPKGVVKVLSVHQGGSAMPEAKDFFDEIKDATDVKAAFVSGALPTELGEHTVKIQLTDTSGNKTKYTTILNVIVDTEAPKFDSLPSVIYGYVGQGISYREGVVISDNCFGVRLEVDSESVDTKTRGTYGIIYHAIDAAGNRTSATAEVIIQDTQITKEMLNEKIAEIAKEQGMSKDLSREEICKRIYAYINDPTKSASQARFRYVGSSNDPTRSDWIREAWLGLQNGQGDCYTYFALSKAFFEYFGFENKDIERTRGLTSDTHFWNMVNIGTEQAPRWYFFDATRYAGKFSVGGNNGCLLTLDQLKSYTPNASGYGDNYYAFDSSAYPAAQTEIINKNYSWN